MGQAGGTVRECLGKLYAKTGIREELHSYNPPERYIHSKAIDYQIKRTDFKDKGSSELSLNTILLMLNVALSFLPQPRVHRRRRVLGADHPPF
jgi:hypothetical protein